MIFSTGFLKVSFLLLRILRRWYCRYYMFLNEDPKTGTVMLVSSLIAGLVAFAHDAHEPCWCLWCSWIAHEFLLSSPWFKCTWHRCAFIPALRGICTTGETSCQYSFPVQSCALTSLKLRTFFQDRPCTSFMMAHKPDYILNQCPHATSFAVPAHHFMYDLKRESLWWNVITSIYSQSLRIL